MLGPAKITHNRVKNYGVVLPLFTEPISSVPGSMLSPRDARDLGMACLKLMYKLERRQRYDQKIAV